MFSSYVFLYHEPKQHTHTHTILSIIKWRVQTVDLVSVLQYIWQSFTWTKESKSDVHQCHQDWTCFILVIFDKVSPFPLHSGNWCLFRSTVIFHSITRKKFSVSSLKHELVSFCSESITIIKQNTIQESYGLFQMNILQRALNQIIFQVANGIFLVLLWAIFSWFLPFELLLVLLFIR